MSFGKKDNENDKNINITLINPDDDKDTIVISMSEMWNLAKKFFALWIVLAIVAAMFFAGIAKVFQKSFYVGDMTALIGLSYDGAEDGLDPDGNELDITKIKSPSVIEDALSNLDMGIENSDRIRQNIEITGVIPEEAMDELSMYYDVFSAGSGSSLQAAQSLLDTSYYPTKYLVKLNYFSAGYSFEQGKEILNEILNSYRTYFFETYNYNVALGSSVSVVDYSTYDYAEAVNIFSDSLSSVTEYLNNIKQSDSTNFRSTKTGLSFDDLLAEAELIKSNDLDQASSYITVNNVTKNDNESMVSYYSYLVENLERKKSISQSTLNSLNDSIESYEKDPLVLLVKDQSSDESTSDDDVNKAYDELINKKVETQKDISNYNKSIRYYNTVIKAFSKAGKSTDENISEAEDYLSVLNERLTKLIENTNETSEEYYSSVAFADAYKILVPASGSQSEVISGSMKMPLIITEGLLFVIYIGIAFIGSVIISNRNKKVKTEKDEVDTIESKEL